MNVELFLTRALSGIDKNTVYKSPGKMPSIAASVWPENARNDCSGFVNWCLRFSSDRKVDHPLYENVNGGWFETTGIYEDGIQPVGYFRELSTPVPGALLVYPDYRDGGRTRQGHIGIVLEVNGNGIEDVTEVIHCSLGNYKEFDDAIRITAPDAWLDHEESICVWYEGLEKT